MKQMKILRSLVVKCDKIIVGNIRKLSVSVFACYSCIIYI